MSTGRELEEVQAGDTDDLDARELRNARMMPLFSEYMVSETVDIASAAPCIFPLLVREEDTFSTLAYAPSAARSTTFS